MKSKALLFAMGLLAMLSAASNPEQRLAISVMRVPHGGIQPQMTVDGTGALHLLYFAGDPKAGDLFYVKSADGGVTWSKPIRVNSVPGSATALGTIRGGQIAI